MGLGSLTVLARRADFLAAARGRRRSAQGFTLQARRRATEEAAEGVRVGFTCSKKVGNAVARNRAKRRLRAAARAVLAVAGRPGWDYVLVGKPVETAALPFDRLVADLAAATAAIHEERRRDQGPKGGARPAEPRDARSGDARSGDAGT